MGLTSPWVILGYVCDWADEDVIIWESLSYVMKTLVITTRLYYFGSVI